MSAMRASGPTAGPSHAFAHLVDADLDAALSRLFFLGRRDPADPLIPRQRGDFGPEALRLGVGFDGSPEIGWKLVHLPKTPFIYVSRVRSTEVLGRAHSCFDESLGMSGIDFTRGHENRLL